MTGLNFDDLRWLHLLWVVLAVAGVGGYGIWARRRALRRFAAVGLWPRLVAATGRTRPLVRLLLVVTALLALVAALIGPRWGQQTQTLLRRNIDALILLDVSRSMLARDIAPNRLERAKLAIRDDLLPALGGDRIGLITFAGLPSLACPLTSDYGFFRLALDDVTTRSSPRGGTLIGDAVRKAGKVFEADQLDSHKVIVLITDGEDHDSFPVEAAASIWKDQKVPVIALALGDPEQGVRIPVGTDRGEEYIEYGGQFVRSKADFAALERVAAASPRGVFVGVGTSNFDLGEIYGSVARAIHFDEEYEEHRVRQPSRYHPFALAALVLVLLDSLLRDGPRKPAAEVQAGPRRHVAAIVLLLLIVNVAARADTPRESIVRGNGHYAAGRYAEALQAYEEAAAGAASSPELLHDRAAAHFKLGQLEEARDLWVRLKATDDPALEARGRYNLGNCDYAEALTAAQQDPQRAIELLGQAAEQYRAALGLDGFLEDARANLELAHQLKRQIEEQLQQQSQSQPSSDQSQEQQQDQQQQSTQPSQSQDQQQSEQQQGDSSQDSRPETQPSDSQQPQSGEQEDQQRSEQQEDEQQKEDQDNQQQQNQPETMPAEPPPSASERDREDLPPIEMTREQAERLLQMIRDAEKARREKLARQQAARQKPVERDW